MPRIKNQKYLLNSSVGTEDYNYLKKRCEDENRSLSNLIALIIKQARERDERTKTDLLRQPYND